MPTPDSPSAGVERAAEPSPEALRAAVLAEAGDARADLDADRVAQALREGSTEVIDAQREAAYQAHSAEVQGMIGRHRACLADVRTTLLPAATHVGDSNLRYLETLMEQLEADPVDGDKSPFLRKLWNSPKERPQFRVDVYAIVKAEEQLRRIDAMPGLSAEEHRLLATLHGLLLEWKRVDPLAVQIHAGIQAVDNSPHMQFAGKLGKSTLLVLGSAAFALGIGTGLIRLLQGKRPGSQEFMLIVGPLLAWGFLKRKQIFAPVETKVADQVNTFSSDDCLRLLKRNGIAGPEWRGVIDGMFEQGNKRIIAAHLADPRNLEKRQELQAALAAGLSDDQQETLASMIANGDFEKLYRYTSGVTRQEARELVTDYIALGGWRSPVDYAALERELTTPVA